MTSADLPGVERVARLVHPAYPEAIGVMAERQRLYPPGCLVLPGGEDILGYAISHPWLSRQPPKLDSRLGRLPVRPDIFYIHDIALLPAARGTGAGSAVLHLLAAQAKADGVARLALIAVNGSAGFWQRHGFGVVQDAALAEKLLSYGPDARYMMRDAPPG